MITIKKIRCSGRDSYLIRGIGKRAISADIAYNSNGISINELIESEHEIYWLLLSAGKYATKRKWKTVIVKHETLSTDLKNCKVYVCNCSGCTDILGYYRDIVSAEHFLKDQYYDFYYKGLLIK